MSSFVSEWKAKGNEAFKLENFVEAIEAYSQALSQHSDKDETRSTLLCNRAACHLKLVNYAATVSDCTEALDITPSLTKALFRRACGYEGQSDNKAAAKDLTALLHLDPKNAQGITMLRRVKEAVQREQSTSSEVKNILDVSVKDASKLPTGLGALIGLCYDDRNHALDLYRKGGVAWVCEVVNKELGSWLQKGEEKPTLASTDVLVSAIRVLSAASNHRDFILSAVNIAYEDSVYDARKRQFEGVRLSMHATASAGASAGRAKKLSFVSVCSLLTVLSGSCAIPAVLMLIMNTLKAFPAMLPSATADAPAVYTVSRFSGQALLTGLRCALDTTSPDAFTAVTDTISSFLSDSADYFDTHSKEIDVRMEGVEARKLRFYQTDILKTRSKSHCAWAVECGVVQQLISNVDSEIAVIRQNSSNCLGKVINYVEDVEILKPVLLPYLPGRAPQEEPSESKRVVELLDDDEEDGSASMPLRVPECRRRAALEASLLLAHPDLGSWALELPGGVPQLHFLVATGDTRCLEVAAEVICLSSALESGATLLSSVVASGTLNTLLHAPSPSIRAAAASTITKLSIKAKALTQDSAEVSQILNTALAVLKSANAPPEAQAKLDAQAGENGDHLVSFSAMDEVSHARALHKKSETDKADKTKASFGSSSAMVLGGGITMTAVERAIESLAALVGKSYIKEEIVHGSYRVAACVAELTKLDLDVRSTAAYGVAHILCALTVTNRELRAIALADKDITPEQYEQMQELQRIKTKDENGQTIEEKKEDSDLDTPDLCCRRIKRIVACDAVKFLVKYLSAGSEQTKEAAARALRQIAVEASVRGLIVQQGALKACCAAASDEDNKKATRNEAAHAVAKTLVTTNPNLLSEHQRLGCIKPLVMLCRDSTSTELQQFESLLALTNILSCGTAEHDKFVAEKGVGAVHYLIFSENWMVRRAAVEALCNMATNEHVLKLLCSGDKMKLWLGLCEEGVGLDEDEEDLDASVTPEARRAWVDEQQQKYLAARASAGTLASAAGADDEVCRAMCEQDCAKTIAALLESQKPELVHRALVWITEMVTASEDASLRAQCAVHLVEGGVVGAISVVLKMGDMQLGGLAREAAQALSNAVGKNSGAETTAVATR